MPRQRTSSPDHERRCPRTHHAILPAMPCTAPHHHRQTVGTLSTLHSYGETAAMDYESTESQDIQRTERRRIRSQARRRKRLPVVASQQASRVDRRTRKVEERARQQKQPVDHLIRKYRDGQLPDTQIKHTDLVSPCVAHNHRKCHSCYNHQQPQPLAHTNTHTHTHTHAHTRARARARAERPAPWSFCFPTCATLNALWVVCTSRVVLSWTVRQVPAAGLCRRPLCSKDLRHLCWCRRGVGQVRRRAPREAERTPGGVL